VRLLFDHDDDVAKFVASLIPNMQRGFGKDKAAIGVLDDDGALIAGLVYNNWNPDFGTIELTGASVCRRWMTRDVLQFMYDYPFLVCKCQMLLQYNSVRNKHLNEQLRRAGFNEYPVRRLRGRDEDGILFTLTDEQWASSPFNLRNRKKR
jgi:hypothetical protein